MVARDGLLQERPPSKEAGKEAADVLFVRDGEPFHRRDAVHVKVTGTRRPYVALLVGLTSDVYVSGKIVGGKPGMGSTKLAVRWLVSGEDVGGLRLSSGERAMAQHELFLSDSIDYVSIRSIMDKVCLLNSRDFGHRHHEVSVKTGRGTFNSIIAKVRGAHFYQFVNQFADFQKSY